jgi:hypothetical protein
MTNTHATWRQLNAAWRLENDECSVEIIRPGDREGYRNTARDPFASFPLTILDRELGRAEAACLCCDRPLQDGAGATGIVIMPVAPDLAHLAETYILCPLCANGRDDDGIIAMIGDAP